MTLCHFSAVEHFLCHTFLCYLNEIGVRVFEAIKVITLAERTFSALLFQLHLSVNNRNTCCVPTAYFLFHNIYIITVLWTTLAKRRKIMKEASQKIFLENSDFPEKSFVYMVTNHR